MKSFNVTNLKHMVDILQEDKVKNILLKFSCPLNRDVELFLHEKAIEFAKQGLAGTYIVTTSYKGEQEIIGYFTLSFKLLHASKNRLSKTWQKRMAKFGMYDINLKKYSIPAPLIGQLSKNYTGGLDDLITGDELLSIALEKISTIQNMIGGKMVFLECQAEDRLIEFYNRNGFIVFGERPLDPDEIDLIPGEYLVQMIKYLR